MQQSRLLVLVLIMVVNALAYGTIIPLLDPYAKLFGLDTFQFSMLFVSFSIAQFIATPIMGRLSDRYGRKPILTICILTTALSLGMFAMAKSVVVLFLARILDGIGSGSLSVAQASISDATTGKERTKAFGILSAAFAFGFLFGPAIGGVLSKIHISTPFWFSAILGILATILCIATFKETLPEHKRITTHHEPLFRMQTLFQAAFVPLTGVALLVTLLTSIAHYALVICFQVFTADIFKLSPLQVGLLFTLISVLTVVMQTWGIKTLLQRFPSKSTILIGSLFASAIVLALLFWQNSLIYFILISSMYVVVSAPQAPIISALLSERSKNEDQGGILGLNQAYTSIGQIIGFTMAGIVAKQWSLTLIFALSSGFFLLATLVGRGVDRTKSHKKLDL